MNFGLFISIKCKFSEDIGKGVQYLGNDVNFYQVNNDWLSKLETAYDTCVLNRIHGWWIKSEEDVIVTQSIHDVFLFQPFSDSAFSYFDLLSIKFTGIFAVVFFFISFIIDTGFSAKNDLGLLSSTNKTKSVTKLLGLYLKLFFRSGCSSCQIVWLWNTEKFAKFVADLQGKEIKE